MHKLKRLWRGFALSPILTALFLATVFPAQPSFAQESAEGMPEVNTRAPGNNAGPFNKPLNNQQLPPGFASNRRVLSPRETQEKWNRYLSDPRWRALEQEARKRGYRRAKGEKRLWGYEADVVNSDRTTSRVEFSVFDLERGNDGAALIWLQTNADAKVLLIEVPEGKSIQDAAEWTANSKGEIGPLGGGGEIRSRSLYSYLSCMTGGREFYEDRLMSYGIQTVQVALLTTSAVGCGAAAIGFGPFAPAVWFPCMFANAGAALFLTAHSVCYRYW